MTWRAIVTVVVMLAVLGLVAGLGYHGYSRLEVTATRPTSVVEQFEVEHGSVLDTLKSFTVDDWVKLIALAIEGVKVEATVSMHNRTFVPLYIPAIDHQIYLEGHRFGSPVRTPSIVLHSWEKREIPVSVTLTLADLPPAALALLHSEVSGGKVDLTVESTAKVGLLTYKKTTTLTITVPQLPIPGLSDSGSLELAASVPATGP